MNFLCSDTPTLNLVTIEWVLEQSTYGLEEMTGKDGKWTIRYILLLGDEGIVKDWVSILGTRVSLFPIQCSTTSLDTKSLTSKDSTTGKGSETLRSNKRRNVWGSNKNHKR